MTKKALTKNEICSVSAFLYERTVVGISLDAAMR